MVTALFVDIMDSTELGQNLDPEEARAIIDPVLGLMIDAVRRSRPFWTTPANEACVVEAIALTIASMVLPWVSNRSNRSAPTSQLRAFRRRLIATCAQKNAH